MRDLRSVQSDLSAPALLSVKIYHMSGISRERGRGNYVRVRVGYNDSSGVQWKNEQVSKKSRGIHPKEKFGFGIKQSKIMCRLAEDGTPVETIARAFKLDASIVEEVISAQSGENQRFGWDEAIHSLIHEPLEAVISVDILIQDKWYPLGLNRAPLLEFLEFSESFDTGRLDADRGRFHTDELVSVSAASDDLDKPWHVLDYNGGRETVTVGLDVEIRTAVAMDERAAVASFELGRLGGPATKRGGQALQEFLSISPDARGSSKSLPVGKWFRRLSSQYSGSLARTRSGSLGETPKAERQAHSSPSF